VITAQPMDVAGPLPAPRCFRTFADAIADATSGTVRLDEDAHTLSRSELRLGRAWRTSTVLGIEYDKASYGGWSYVIQGAGDSGCRLGARYKVPTLPGTRNNAISSARAFGGCKSRHFSGPNLTGTSHLCSCASMGLMDNQTSSIRFTSTGN